MTPEEQAELLSTQVLYDELLSRFDSVIFSGVKARPEEGKPDQKVTSWRVRGDYVVCAGLACGIIHECSKMRDEDETEIQTDEL